MEALYEKEIACPVSRPCSAFRLRICTIGKHSRSTCPNNNACAHRSTNPGADSHTVPAALGRTDSGAHHGGVRAGLGRQLAGKCKLPYAGLHTQCPAGWQTPPG